MKGAGGAGNLEAVQCGLVMGATHAIVTYPVGKLDEEPPRGAIEDSLMRPPVGVGEGVDEARLVVRVSVSVSDVGLDGLGVVGGRSDGSPDSLELGGVVISGGRVLACQSARSFPRPGCSPLNSLATRSAAAAARSTS